MSRLKIDKLLHFIAGTYIYMISAAYMQSWIGLLLVAIIGATKEIVWDKLLGKGTPEVADFIWTMIGGLFTFLIFLL